MNKIMLIGNLGKDPDMSYTNSGAAVTKFSLAVANNRKENGEWVNGTDWFTIVAWNQLAERCSKQLQKGNKVYIEGRLSQRKYTDKQGVERLAIEVIAGDMETLSPKNVSQQPVEEDLDEHPF
jgi:single-strand DNA-binding protein